MLLTRPSSSDQELARVLLEAGLLDRRQVTAAAKLQSPDKHFTAIIVEMGWLSPEDIARRASRISFHVRLRARDQRRRPAKCRHAKRRSQTFAHDSTDFRRRRRREKSGRTRRIRTGRRPGRFR